MNSVIETVKRLATKCLEYAKVKLMALRDSYNVEVTEQEFDFYKKVECYPKRYVHCKQQYSDNKIECKRHTFNWFAFLFPVAWSIRVKNSLPIFYILCFSIVVLGGGAAYIEANTDHQFYSRLNQMWIDYEVSTNALIFEAIQYSLGWFLFLMLPIRFILGFYGDSIENIALLKRFKPIMKFVFDTGNEKSSGQEKIIKRRSWFKVVIGYFIFYAPLFLLFTWFKLG